MYLNQTDRLPRKGSCLPHLCAQAAYSLSSSHILPFPALNRLTYFLLPSLVSTSAIKTREVEVEDAAPESAGSSLCSFWHFRAHYCSYPSDEASHKNPRYGLWGGQKGVNHFVAKFIGQCLLILLACQIQRYTAAQNDKSISRWITYFKANQ